jgi:predicted DCC family thiol-disulfide oxidoreductase YuxK
LNVLSKFADKYFRIDPRSLGLFRIAIGLVLIGDLFERWGWIDAFYSNDGVVPNHNHIFVVGSQGHVWSVYHAFSSTDENHFAFVVTLFVYLCFTLGWHTRAFHWVSVVCLVGLSARNVLLETVGNSVAIALLGMTAFLRLGDAFSVDSLRRSFSDFDEDGPKELNDRSRPPEPDPPRSFAALGVVLVLGIIYFGAALQQNGPAWKDGTALYYALHVDRWTDVAGVWLRDRGGALLGPWTHALRVAQMIVLPLALVPVARRWLRPVTIGAMAFHALTFVVLFTWGLYGWSLLAACALLIPEESWDGLTKKTRPIDVYYDDDCGICLWCARLLKRMDLRHDVTFKPNSDAEALPEGVTAEDADRSMIVVHDGVAHRDVAAVSEIMRALPLLGWLGLLLKVPGIEHLGRWLYYKVARNRLDISVALGMGACGLPQAGAEPEVAIAAPTPAQRTWRVTRAATSSVLALALLAAVVAQTERNNPALPFKTGLGNRTTLANAASWSRILAPWGVLAPEPPRENTAMVVDATTRAGWQVDLVSGFPPDLELGQPAAVRNGVLWSSYAEQIRHEEYGEFRKELRRYLSKGGHTLDGAGQEQYVTQLTAWWLSQPIPAPGQAKDGEIQREELLSKRGVSTPTPPVRPGLPRLDHDQ